MSFIPNAGHKASDMFNSLLNFLKMNDLYVKKIRGQSYDNASVMSGEFGGLQALVKEVNNLTAWIPSCNHSLNLVR